jgi:phosphoribosylformimino-5-aminoimidazole carboxamide ribonucleotide (ProFAR) isomerase
MPIWKIASIVVLIKLRGALYQEQSVIRKWIQEYGSDKIILGADANNEKVAISGGWKN